MNKFENLDAQDEISSLAQLRPEEQAEYCAWLDEVNAKMDAAE